MRYVKFTSVKLTIHVLFLICLLYFISPLNSLLAQQFVIQVAASKSPLDIQYFSKINNISQPITEKRYEDWYRYFVGNFEDLHSASKFASDFALQTGITGVFPRKLGENSDSYVQKQKKDSVYQAKNPLDLTAVKDSGSLIAEKAASNADPDISTRNSIKKPGRKSNKLFLLIFGKKNVIELQKNLIAYGDNHLPSFFRKFYIRIIETTYTYPIILLFIFLIFALIINLILVLLVLNYTNKWKNRKDRYLRIYGNLYEGVLRLYLFGEINWEETFVKLKRNKKPFNRKILTSVILNFQENLRGGMDNQMPEIFVKLGLNKDALKSTKSSFYYNKVQGIRELTNLFPKGAEEIIQKYINSHNDLVRAEAQASYIRLHPEKPFDFLRRLTSPFTRWTQLSAFYLFRLHQLTVPSFIDYLDSANSNVRNFCLRMISFFQQLENASEIIKMLDSQMELTRFLSIRAINDLRLFDGKKLMKNRYPDETEKNRMEIIKALKNIGNAEDFDFLETIFKSGSITAKTEACRSLYFMNAEGRERLMLLNQNADLKVEQYLAHVTDPRN